MQITTTTIRHKRYSYLGWSDKNPDGTLINTLAQGEIGVLLSDDLETVLEVRLGVTNNSSFFDGVILGASEAVDICVRPYASKFELPTLGNEYTVYIVKKTNQIYRWDNTDRKYYPVSAAPGQGEGWWKEVNGGGAELDRNLLGSSTPINW